MMLTKSLQEWLSVPKEEREEFRVQNSEYNNKAAIFIAAVLIVLFSLVIFFGNLSLQRDTGGIDDFWLLFAGYFAGIVLSATGLIFFAFLRKKNLSRHWISDLVLLIYVILIMAALSFSGHTETQATGIRNVDLIILAMFTIVFCFRLNLSWLLAVETACVAANVVLLVVTRDAVSNFFPNMLSILSALVLVCFAAGMSWESRVRYFINTKNIEKLVNSDALTRVHNRRGFDIYIAQAWEKAQGEKNSSLALFIIDIDHFKSYNDTYGHVEGDKCLIMVADVISQSVRKIDFVARYGGEEFAVVLPGIGKETAGNIAERMLADMRKRGIPHGSSVTPYVTFSIGCMICHPAKTSVKQQDFVAMADHALYMAKNEGRNRFVMHPDTEK